MKFYCVAVLLAVNLMSCGFGGDSKKSQKITGTEGKVVKIINGKTIELQKGLQVSLIGVKDSIAAKEWLDSEVKDKNVLLIADSKDKKQTYVSNSDKVRAYVRIKGKKMSINGQLLLKRKASLDQGYCKDSNEIFKKHIINPIPDIKTDPELFAFLKPATFLIVAQKGDKNWMGTGFYINNNGLALTNNHVLPLDVDAVRIYYYNQNGHIDKTNFRDVSRILTSWKSDNGKFDVTLFKVRLEEGEKACYLPLIPKQEQQGVKLAKLGNPNGEACNFQTGNLSQYYNDYGYFVHSCPTNHGDSGGPVVNQRGQVVGINQSIDLTDVYGSIDQIHGVAYAVDVTLLRQYMDQEGIEYGR